MDHTAVLTRSYAHHGGYRSLQALIPVAFLVALAAAAQAAAPDNNIEWNGVSHVSWQDRRPLCPLGGESFDIRFQTYAGDITSARVHVDDGGSTWVVASLSDARGPYDIWTAMVPATASPTLAYYIELTDGTDTDYVSVNGISEATPTDGGFVLDYDTLEHAPVGATPHPDGGTIFKVWSPERTVCHVRGEFNSWGLGNPMDKVGEHFITYVPNASPNQLYKYFFQNVYWNTDPRARGLVPGDNYNARIVDPFAYEWNTEGFPTPDLAEMVIYQLHVGTFAGRNDPYGAAPFPARYVDIANRVSHLADLGVNAVMLTPITEFPGDLSAGYNPVTQWSPESKYGSTDDLKTMVDALHARGIAVLLDIVWNHFSFTDNFLWNYDGTQIYYDDPAIETPWGNQADFDRDAVRDYFADSALYWLEEIGVDGFRMDATSYMNIFPQEASGWSLMQRLNDEVDNRWGDKPVIAEQLPDNPWVTRPTSLGGAGFDSQYYDVFTDRLREEIFDAAFGNAEMWRIQGLINGGGQYLEGRSATNYLELHDEAWPSSGGQRIVKSIDTTFPHDDMWAKGRVKLAQGLVMTAPGVPAILQGTEWLEDTDFGTDSGNRIDWSKKVTYAPIVSYFRDLITLRRLSPALRADAPHQVFHMNESGDVIVFQRYDTQGNVLVVVANFSNGDYGSYRIGLPQPGDWFEVLNSQASGYDGNGLTNPGTIVPDAISQDGFAQSAEIAVPQMGLLVLSWGESTSVPDEPGSPSDAGDGGRLLRAFPNPLRPSTTVEFAVPSRQHVNVTIYDVAGRKVRVLANGTHDGGRHERTWDGRDDEGRPLASGIYFLRLESHDVRETAKLVLLR
jgi:1,4-alpha-glucan branching enzyme